MDGQVRTRYSLPRKEGIGGAYLSTLTSRKVDFAFRFGNLRTADFAAQGTTEKGYPETLQTCLRQFPAVSRLDLDLAGYHLGDTKFRSVLGEDWTQVTLEMIGTLGREGQLGGPRQITDLVINRYSSGLIYLVVAVPLPSLTRLHVCVEHWTGFASSYHTERYHNVFKGWSNVAAIWRSLKKVEVCITLTVTFKEYIVGEIWNDQQHGKWNLWVSQTTFSSCSIC
jgi:hypothetical protein